MSGPEADGLDVLVGSRVTVRPISERELLEYAGDGERAPRLAAHATATAALVPPEPPEPPEPAERTEPAEPPLAAAAAAAGHPAGTGLAVEALVIGAVGSVLRLETRDRRIDRLGRHAVAVERGSEQMLLHLAGELSVLAHGERNVLAEVAAWHEPVLVQRRAWIRVPAGVPVTIVAGRGRLTESLRVVEADEPEPVVVRTTTVDLSAGGCRLAWAEGLDAIATSSRVEMTVELPTEPLTVDAELLRGSADGGASLRFIGVPESVSGRLAKFVFQLQVEARRMSL